MPTDQVTKLRSEPGATKESVEIWWEQMETDLVAVTYTRPKGSSLPLHPLPCSGMHFSPAQPPALTSAEHQAQRGLTARHCLQEFTPRVVQMLPPETAKQSNYCPQNPNSHVLLLLSSQSPISALLYPLSHL